MSKKTTPSKQADKARDEVVTLLQQCRKELILNVPIAMSPLPSSAKWGFALVTISLVAIRLCTGAAIWLVRVKL